MAGAPTQHHPTTSPQAVASNVQQPLVQQPLVQRLQQARDLAASVLDSVAFSLLSEAEAMAVLGTV